MSHIYVFFSLPPLCYHSNANIHNLLCIQRFVDRQRHVRVSICSNALACLRMKSFNLRHEIFFLIILFFSFPLICPLGTVFHSYASPPSLTPDDDVFKHLSLVYASNHAKMSRGVACKTSASTPSFQNGITNGKWLIHSFEKITTIILYIRRCLVSTYWRNAGLQLCLVWMLWSYSWNLLLQIPACYRIKKILDR